MINWKKVAVLCMTGAMLMSGCGASGTDDNKDDKSTKVEDSSVAKSENESDKDGAEGQNEEDTDKDDAEGQKEEDADKDNAEGQDEDNTDKDNAEGQKEGDTDKDNSDDQNKDAGEDGDEEIRELTQSELDEFTHFIQGYDTYGFLLSEYTDPSGVDLSEVFYSGAGFGSNMTDEEVDAYLKANNYDSLNTDCVKVKKSDAKKLIEERLGLNLDEMKTDDIGCYLPGYDAYYHECGDTNYTKFICVGGVTNGNVYTLDFKADSEFGYTLYPKVHTVLEKTDDGYKFISNQRQNQ